MIPQALAKSKWLRNQIKNNTNGKLFSVTAIIIFLGWYIPWQQMKYKDIWVTNPKLIESLITAMPQIMKPNDVQTVVKVISHKTKVQRST